MNQLDYHAPARPRRRVRRAGWHLAFGWCAGATVGAGAPDGWHGTVMWVAIAAMFILLATESIVRRRQ